MSGDRTDPPGDAPAGDAHAWASDRVDAILDEAASESGPIVLGDLLNPVQERRVEPRYSLEEPARVQIDSWADFLELYTKDISHNGLFIQSDAPPELGAKVGVDLLLPDGSGTIRFKGEVRHVVTAQTGPIPGFGVRFYGVTQDAQNTLQWIVAQAKSVARAVAKGPGVVPRPQRPTTAEMKVAREVSPAQAEREECRRLRAVLCDVAARSDLAVLDLPPSPTLEQIDQAFARLARQYDPQRRSRARSAEVAKLYQQIYFRIDRAYRRVRSTATASAEAYVQALASPTLGTLE